MTKTEGHCCVSHMFWNVASSNPKKIAVIHASEVSEIPKETFDESASSASKSLPLYDGDKFFTYEELSSSVRLLSSRLRSILDGADDPYLLKSPCQGNHAIPEAGGTTGSSETNSYTPRVLGIFIPPSVEYIVSVLSVLNCGEAFVPLDPSWPKHRILSIVSSSNASLVISCGLSLSRKGCQPLDKSHWLVESGICPVLLFSMEDKPFHQISDSNCVLPCERGKERSFCYVMFTSGSTGNPKGVCGTEQGLLNRFSWMEESYPMLADERLLFKTSICFIDHLQEVLGAVITATTLVIPPITAPKQNLYSVLDFLQAYSISRLIAVPSLMRAILPALESSNNKQIQNSLRLIVLSGEAFPVSLWEMLRKLLPNTSVLNLYGSTEVSGDCMYFDCEKFPQILEMNIVSSVPIGRPIANCDIVLLDDGGKTGEGEIIVAGVCVCNGYLNVSSAESKDFVKMHGNSICNHLNEDCGSRLYYRTGDFARQIPSGDFVFLGRKDRTIKLNGQRITLEEIEATLLAHPSISEAAVVLHRDQEEPLSLEAFIVPKEHAQLTQNLKYSAKKWVSDKLPSATVPKRFSLMDSLPITSSGKVDYDSLAGLRSSKTHVQDAFPGDESKDMLQIVKKAFCDALVVEEVFDDDDFFAIGGDSLSAAHLSHSLGIDMRLLYKSYSPIKLALALSEKEEFRKELVTNYSHQVLDLGKKSCNGFNLVDHATSTHAGVQPNSSQLRSSSDINGHISIPKRLKVELENSKLEDPWILPVMPIRCSFSRSNKVLYWYGHNKIDTGQATSVDITRNRSGSLQELWKVHMESCVDASPLVVFKDSDIYLFIGSHSQKFLCLDAKSGYVRWETNLEGRIESSAAITSDFSQVVVGCYKGKIYFIDFSSGSICWTFQTHGEVKCQPVMEKSRQLIWCGSHDHNLYALDYRKQRCVFEIQCGGSIFGSPAVDEDRGMVYVASTSGRVTAVSAKVVPFVALWLLELEVPIFGSLTVNPIDGIVICCLVDGHAVALNPTGAIIWKYRTAGPIFAGATVSHVLPLQVLLCSRNGSIFSVNLENGSLIWEYNIGEPITASAYVDEHLLLKANPSSSSNRLVCICSSLGSTYVLGIDDTKIRQPGESYHDAVQELAKLNLQGDVFSSPVMIGGRIFVGCRDDYVHCISLSH